MIEVEPENTPLSHPGQLMMTTEADMGSNFSYQRTPVKSLNKMTIRDNPPALNAHVS